LILDRQLADPLAGCGKDCVGYRRRDADCARFADAAGRLGLALGAGDIHVQQVTARDWPDSSLGCPLQGEMYSQIVTPGYLVVISAAGKQLEYHADSRGLIVLCQES